MRQIKGPAVFLAQFLREIEPFHHLSALGPWMAGWGYQGVQIPTWDLRVIDLDQAAASKAYCEDLRGQLAAMGLEPARIYARIAPASSHARHMPSHVFLPLGMWDDAAASDESAFAASVDRVKRLGLSMADVVQGWVEALVGAGDHVGGTAVSYEQQLADLLLVDERAGLGDRL